MIDRVNMVDTVDTVNMALMMLCLRKQVTLSLVGFSAKIIADRDIMA